MLHLILAIPLTAMVALLWLPQISEALCLWRGARRKNQPRSVSQETPRLLFLVPAHDEELMIEACVRSVVGLSYPPEARRVIVIADNCTDSTAGLAVGSGAECLERSDRLLPGKPRAIAWSLEQIPLEDWDAIVIVDADTTLDPGFARALALHAPLNEIILQANFGVLNEWQNWLTRLGGVLSRCRYEVTYPLKQSAGLNCPLTGNGMCIGTKLLMRNGWQAFSIAEDSELFAQYTAAGVPIRHADLAHLYSQEASSLSQGTTQRRRWLAGRLWVLRRYGRAILRSREIGWHQKLDAVVELVLASPVLHLAGAIAVAVLAMTLMPGRLGLGLAIGALASLSGLVLTTLIVVWHHPQPLRTAAAFLMLVVYAPWRVLIAFSTLVTLGDTRWRKTSRQVTR